MLAELEEAIYITIEEGGLLLASACYVGPDVHLKKQL